MNPTFVRNRITELRLQKGVSEYKMSTYMGHSKSYIQSITAGRTLPSMTEFLYMCEYLEVTPKTFFDNEIEQGLSHQKIVEGITGMSEDDLKVVLTVVDRLAALQKVEIEPEL